MTNKLIETLLKYAFSVENPIVSVLFILIIAFILFAITRKFFDTEFIKKSKEDREQIREVNQTLSNDYQRLKLENDEMQKEIDDLKKQLDIK